MGGADSLNDKAAIGQGLVETLTAIVGQRHLLTAPDDLEAYCEGIRFGKGAALAVARPASLVEMWRVICACVEAEAVVLMQAANTGLTGGSTPYGNYDRPVIIVSGLRIDGAHLVDEGRQVVCFPGTTLYELETRLAPLGREPHSVIGSSCIGASVMGGVCNNSGGALIQRGPAYTEYALYAQRGANGVLRLVNHLGVELPGDPEAMLRRLERGDLTLEPEGAGRGGAASDRDYVRRIRDTASALPARYNADPGRLHEASGCAGKLAVFAVRLDTFPKPAETRLFYIGTNDPGRLRQIRSDMLADFTHLPVAAEYMHRDCFDIADSYGKDMFVALRLLGTARLPWLFAVKSRLDRIGRRLGLGKSLADRWLQRLSRLLPDHLPPRMRAFRDRFEHHLLLHVADDAIAETRAYLAASANPNESGYFECTAEEGSKALLHRFVAAGAAIRYRDMHADSVEDIVALDIALPRNTVDWNERLPADLAQQAIAILYYGHFFCHVFHQDYILHKGSDPHNFEREMWRLLDARGARYPAEHNVGHLYPADAALQDFYRGLDPTNSFNPGIGQLTKRRDWL